MPEIKIDPPWATRRKQYASPLPGERAWSFHIFHAVPAWVKVRSVSGKSETCNPDFLPVGNGEPILLNLFLPVGNGARIMLTRHLGSGLVGEGRDGRGTGQPHRVARRIWTNVQTDAENVRQIVRRR